MLSTDDGTQIDWSAEHSSNADSPRLETLPPDANRTDKTESHQPKHPVEIDSISPQIVTSAPFPK
jgi:hypothetical protein